MFPKYGLVSMDGIRIVGCNSTYLQHQALIYPTVEWEYSDII